MYGVYTYGGVTIADLNAAGLSVTSTDTFDYSDSYRLDAVLIPYGDTITYTDTAIVAPGTTVQDTFTYSDAYSYAATLTTGDVFDYSDSFNILSSVLASDTLTYTDQATVNPGALVRTDTIRYLDCVFLVLNGKLVDRWEFTSKPNTPWRTTPKDNFFFA